MMNNEGFNPIKPSENKISRVMILYKNFQKKVDVNVTSKFLQISYF